MHKSQTPVINTEVATIAKDASLSGAVCIAGYHYIAFSMPDQWTASATMTFQVSHDGVTYQDLYDGSSGSEASMSGIAASRNFSDAGINLLLAPWNYLKVRSGTAASAVPQLAARSITVILKE